MTTYSGNCNQSIDKSLYGTSQGLIQRLQQRLAIQQIKADVRRERRQLRGLSDSMLNDLGITRHQAIVEARRIDLPEGRLSQMAKLEC